MMALTAAVPALAAKTNSKAEFPEEVLYCETEGNGVPVWDGKMMGEEANAGKVKPGSYFIYQSVLCLQTTHKAVTDSRLIRVERVFYRAAAGPVSAKQFAQVKNLKTGSIFEICIEDGHLFTPPYYHAVTGHF